MKRHWILLIHMCFWVLVIAIRLPMLIKVTDPSYYLFALVISLIVNSSTFYLYYFIIGKILIKRQIWIFILIYIGFIILYSYPVTHILDFLDSFALKFGIKVPDSEKSDFFKTYLSVATIQSIYALIGTFFSFTISWFRDNMKKEELEKQNIHNELSLLRSQISPHFLFNTLNNLHSFIYRDQDIAAASIIKLSEIMRYMLYETNTEYVLLEKEIAYIENYIELQKLRFKDPGFVKLLIEGNIYGKKIPPLMLITLVENAFKHGQRNTKETSIYISLKIQDNFLTFEVTNYILKKSKNREEYNGFGLKNLERRLDLIYGKDYNIDIREENEKHYVKLQIKTF
jgi:two-component system, LytTR family, sensor kinase